MTTNSNRYSTLSATDAALPERERPLSIGQIKLITRTVGRTPEVMVKVINKGSSSLAGVGGHVGYIGRQGEVELETDEGEILQGQEVGNDPTGGLES